jgi:hypothetical protein
MVAWPSLGHLGGPRIRTGAPRMGSSHAKREKGP